MVLWLGVTLTFSIWAHGDGKRTLFFVWRKVLSRTRGIWVSRQAKAQQSVRCKTKTWRSARWQITYVFWHVITYCKTSLIWASDFSFSVVAACLQNGLMIKKYHWNTAFYASNFQDFQKFPGRCPEPRLGGLQRTPRPPAGLRGASRPAALCAACTLFSKIFHKPPLAPDQLRPWT